MTVTRENYRTLLHIKPCMYIIIYITAYVISNDIMSDNRNITLFLLFYFRTTRPQYLRDTNPLMKFLQIKSDSHLALSLKNYFITQNIHTRFFIIVFSDYSAFSDVLSVLFQESTVLYDLFQVSASTLTFSRRVLYSVFSVLSHENAVPSVISQESAEICDNL